jgi:hypothetical protein
MAGFPIRPFLSMLPMFIIAPGSLSSRRKLPPQLETHIKAAQYLQQQKPDGNWAQRPGMKAGTYARELRFSRCLKPGVGQQRPEIQTQSGVSVADAGRRLRAGAHPGNSDNRISKVGIPLTRLNKGLAPQVGIS